MRRPRCARWCRSRAITKQSGCLITEKPASDRRLFLWQQFAHDRWLTRTVHAERSAEGAKSKLRARPPFDFAATRLRSGRTEEGERRNEREIELDRQPPKPFMLSVAPKARSRSCAPARPSTSPLRGYAQGERRKGKGGRRNEGEIELDRQPPKPFMLSVAPKARSRSCAPALPLRLRRCAQGERRKEGGRRERLEAVVVGQRQPEVIG